MTKAELEMALGIDHIDFTSEEGDKAAKPSNEPGKKPAKANGDQDTSETEVEPTTGVVAEAAKTVAAAKPVVGETVAKTTAETEEEEAEPIAAEGEGVAEAEEAETTPKAPPLKKTWTNHELLIDDVLEELPGEYQQDKAVLLVRDPFWMHAYWDLNEETVARARQEGGERLAVRVHDVTDTLFNGSNSHFSFDILMPFDGQRVWYINAPTDGRTYLIQVGYLRSDNRLITLATSNAAATPRARVSDVVADRFVAIDYERPLTQEFPTAPAAPAGQAPAQPGAVAWALPPEARSGSDVSEQMYQLSLRGTPYWSADIPKYGDYQQAMRTLSSQSLSSWTLSSPQAAQKQQPQPEEKKKKDFWLVADCELIVYGATEPDAKVTVRGQAIELRPDGTFTLRFALPNGIHPIPIHALNADEDMERAITITVTRDTVVPV